jgi:uncharacterized membrane protein
MKINLKFVVIWCIVGFTVGFILAMTGIDLSFWSILFISFIIVLAINSYYIYVFFFTKNVDLVEKYIEKRKKHPYYAAILEIVNGNFERAEHFANQLCGRYKEVQKSVLVHIQIENNQLEEAIKTANEIKNHNIRYYNFALVALMRGNFEYFQQMKNEVKHKGLKYVLEAEAAFKQGNVEEAERLGNLAISSSRGLQRYILVKSLKRQQNNKHRRSFF